MNATIPPRCAEHGTPMQWADGRTLPGYAADFAPLGWFCPCDPGHPVATQDGAS